MLTPDVPIRLRALRYLAGYTSVELLAGALADAGTERGLRTHTLRSIEQGTRPADAKELSEIAAVCEVPLAWFTADFSRLEEISPDPRQTLARELAEAVARAEERQGNTSAASQPQPGEGQERREPSHTRRRRARKPPL